MRRKFSILLIITMLLPILPVFAEGHLAMTVAPSQFSVGDELHIYYTIPDTGEVDLVVLDAQGNVRHALLNHAQAAAGAYDLAWDGRVDGQDLEPGIYVLRLTMEEMRVDMDVTIVGAAGEGAFATTASTTAATSDENTAPPPSSLDALDIFEDETETEAADASAVQNGKTSMTPAYKSTHHPDHENCYWCTPMDITDEAAVWAMLTAPITVVAGDNQKVQTVLRAEPSEDSEGIGVITHVSQGIHVLENRSDGWSLVEVYSSSFHDSKVKAWNKFVTGYIKTSSLKERKPSQEYGIVVDKLTQELYIFQDGKLFTTLRISTGLYNDKQPYNETRSGEFLFVSRVGEFRSDNMYCSMAVRFNSGDLLHEVPHVKNADGTKNYKNTEFKLGTRASHGCIRVQRLRNADGVNMAWIWNNIAYNTTNTKFVIWEDYAGRLIEYPDPSTVLYYNPNGGTSYHSAANCYGVKDEYLPLPGTFTYGELENDGFKKLTACTNCIPLRRMAEIDEINEAHLENSPGEIPQHLRQDN